MRFIVASSVVLASACLLACQSGAPSVAGGPAPEYVSDDPSRASPGGNLDGSGNGAGGSGGGAGTGGQTGAPPDDPERALLEADIVQVQGDLLYALSRYGGLSVIDAANPDRLRLLSRFKTEATPFEMLVRDGVVLALYSDWGRYERAGDDWRWVQSSRVAAIDTRDPRRPVLLAELALPGEVSDSRLVGDVLYVVTYENGGCWGCGEKARTTVASFDVKRPAELRKVDELHFDDADDAWGWRRRSVTVTPQRMYVAGPRYTLDGRGASVIQVVDISDPGGDLREGVSVEAAGEVSSRWQMDEHQGVLRVISQPPSWSLEQPPEVQTFRVESAARLVPLGRTALVLPRPEQLQSVRFDGSRGYAITFERTDPLFTIDLSDPENPRQRGELEMPGWVYHMEPRGDRLLGLGFDPQNADGGLHVSLFDVSDLDTPTMIDRVSFGGDWGYLPEDQDRIHKAFKILDREGLLLVPYSGWTSREGSGCGSYRSGIQLVDLRGDDLVLRGEARTHGDARRALMHRARLIAVSDASVRAFDIADRDAPRNTSSLRLATVVSRTATASDTVVRVGSDWYTDQAALEVTTLDGVEAAEALSTVDLGDVLQQGRCGGSFHDLEVFRDGDRAYVAYQRYEEGPSGEGRWAPAVATLDLRDPARVRVLANVPLAVSGRYGYFGGSAIPDAGRSLVQVGRALVYQRGDYDYDSEGVWGVRELALDVVDLQEPAAPRITHVPLDGGLGHSRLQVAGRQVLYSQWSPVQGQPGKVRFTLERLDLSDPRAPRALPSVSIPGSLLAFDAATGRAVTVDYRRRDLGTMTPEECYRRHGGRAAWLEEPSGEREGLGRCSIVSRSFELVRLVGNGAVREGTHALDDRYEVGSVSPGSGRLFVTLQEGYGWGWGDCWGYGCGNGGASASAPLLVLGGFGSGGLVAGTLDLPVGDSYWYGLQVAASGERAVVTTGYRGKALVIDAADPARPRLVREQSFVGWPSAVEVFGNTALLSLGYDGVTRVSLAE